MGEPEPGQVWRDARGRLYEIEEHAKHMGFGLALVLYRPVGEPRWPCMACPLGGEWDERFTLVEEPPGGR